MGNSRVSEPVRRGGSGRQSYDAQGHPNVSRCDDFCGCKPWHLGSETRSARGYFRLAAIRPRNSVIQLGATISW
jgi:hypothetical protein